jgi:hypothetical protein
MAAAAGEEAQVTDASLCPWHSSESSKEYAELLAAQPKPVPSICSSSISVAASAANPGDNYTYKSDQMGLSS